jgi:hypothetical protein
MTPPLWRVNGGGRQEMSQRTAAMQAAHPLRRVGAAIPAVHPYLGRLIFCPDALDKRRRPVMIEREQKRNKMMSGNPRRLLREAERQFSVRVRIAVPRGGFGHQLSVMHAWLDEVCGETGWTAAPAGLSGIVNDAVAFCFDDAALAQAFINRFCCGYRPVEINRTVEGAFSLRSETPPPRRAALVHRTR